MCVVVQHTWNSIYFKLIASFLVVILPLFLVSLFMNESGKNTVRQEINQSMETNVSFYRTQLDLEFDKIIDFGREYLFDDDLGRLSIASETMSHYERTNTIWRTQRSLMLFKSSSSYIQSVSVAIPGIQRELTSEYEYRLITSWREKEEASYSMRILPSNVDDRLVIRYAYPDTVMSEAASYENRNLMFLIEVELNRRKIQEVLGSFIGNSGGGAMLLAHSGEWDVSHDVEAGDKQAMLAWLQPLVENQVEQAAEVVEIEGQRHMAVFEHSNLLDAYLLVWLPEDEIIGPLQRYSTWYWWLAAVSILAIVAFSSFIYRLIHRPMVTLLSAFRSVESGNFKISIHYPHQDEFSYLYRKFNEMVGNLKQLIQEVYEQKLRAQTAEYRQLQSQINPHFLYNSFFVLSQIARSRQYENVVSFTRYLGNYFQFVTRDGESEVSLEAETAFARTYTDIQSFRFSHRIEVQFSELPVEFVPIIVPRVILQPLIENAYHHGLENKKRNGVIRVSFEPTEKWLIISIEDNGDELSEAQLQRLQHMIDATDPPLETTGMINVHRRLQIRFGAEAGLQISRSASLGGLCVQIRIGRAEEEQHA